MQKEQIQRLALKLTKAQKENYQIEPISSLYEDFTMENAYKVLAETHRLKEREGHKAVGRKIGFTNPAMWKKFGVVEPIWSNMYDSTVEYFEDESICNISNMSEARIEPEIIICFAQTPKIDSSLEELITCIDWIALGYEIVQCHYKGWNFKAVDAIADFALHAKLLVGKKIKIDEILNPIEKLKKFELELYCNDKLLEKGYGYNVLNSPLEAIRHLQKVLKSQEFAKAIEKGEIITTGTITDAFLLKEGDTYKSKISGIRLNDLTIKVLK